VAGADRNDTALGGWLAKGARLATVVISVLLTIYKGQVLEAAAVGSGGLRYGVR
jgi:hypothetical protein